MLRLAVPIRPRWASLFGGLLSTVSFLFLALIHESIALYVYRNDCVSLDTHVNAFDISMSPARVLLLASIFTEKTFIL
ncbi:hypothetical protein F4813DRAFT_361113 [Daldinia decipiens]|uniref:uncharacterized protein n=1 Tax=Daldinia decipiens TaxID=326647 RepID=UPI0020C3C94E|nr:uncharacterized protein F4813DRAFT_361113 [Daldinia decipiens]KAI1657342.1 hypothetical protein F4813DRAFT_361113 [Daldinia decipiens]